MDTIIDELYKRKDASFAAFQAKLIPSVCPEKIIGVRTPDIKELAIWVRKNGLSDMFLRELPHSYFEENQLHAFIISAEKDYDEAVKKVNDFLPQVDNWATCDQMKPKAFNSDRLIIEIFKWIKSDLIYTVRFGVGMLMTHYLDKRFKTDYLDMVAEINSDEYYVIMMQAWYFATALCKHFDETFPYFSSGMLTKEVNNKAIQKAVESRRVTDGQKELLRSFRRK